MQLTCTAWVESLSTRDGGREKIYRSCQKHDDVSFHGLLSISRHLFGISFVTRQKSNLCAVPATQNNTENNYYFYPNNTTTLQSNVFLTGIHRLFVTNNRRSSIPRANNCQSQLQTPHSVLVAPQVVKNMPALCGNQRFISGHLSISLAKCTQSKSIHSISLM